MSWKPCRSSGIMFDRAMRREENYWQQLNEQVRECKPIKVISKTYYHLLIAMRDKERALSGKDRNMFGVYLSKNIIDSFRQSPECVYEPLKQFMV